MLYWQFTTTQYPRLKTRDVFCTTAFPEGSGLSLSPHHCHHPPLIDHSRLRKDNRQWRRRWENAINKSRCRLSTSPEVTSGRMTGAVCRRGCENGWSERQREWKGQSGRVRVGGNEWESTSARGEPRAHPRPLYSVAEAILGARPAVLQPPPLLLLLLPSLLLPMVLSTLLSLLLPFQLVVLALTQP